MNVRTRIIRKHVTLRRGSHVSRLVRRRNTQEVLVVGTINVNVVFGLLLCAVLASQCVLPRLNLGVWKCRFVAIIAVSVTEAWRLHCLGT